MKRIKTVLSIVCLLSLLLTVTTFAEVHKEAIPYAEDGYSVYVINDLKLVIPDYLNCESSTDTSLSFAAKENDVSYVFLTINYLEAAIEAKERFNSSPYEFVTELREVNTLENYDKRDVGDVEKIYSHGMECYLYTIVHYGNTSDHTDLMSKSVFAGDDTANGIYSITYLYPKFWDNTIIVSDFYKMLYTEPIIASDESTKAASSTEEYEPTAGEYLDALASYYYAIASMGEGNYAEGFDYLNEAIQRTDAIDKGEKYNSEGAPSTRSSSSDSSGTQESTVGENLDALIGLLETLSNLESN